MKKHRVLVRQLQAIETLGAVQTICLDKTGTITENRMKVQKIFSDEKDIDVVNGSMVIDGQVIDPMSIDALKSLLLACVLCNETKINGTDKNGGYELFGSSTENALILAAADAGMDLYATQKSYRMLKIRHRSESRLFMSTIHRMEGEERIHSIKGSPPEVLSMCDRLMVNGEIRPLDERYQLLIEKENEKMAGNALRVLGVAFQPLKDMNARATEENLIWLGLVGLSDPVREGAKLLIDEFHRAGVATVMITGDQSSTAYAVAKELGISGDMPLEILDSSELSVLDPNTLRALAKKVHVYSRVSPTHKLKIVEALQSAGRVVAMTGDGINDGPALKAADIGIAMGRTGTDVARDVADVVLEEDQLEILALALQDGRATYQNIRKSLHFFLSTNLSEIMLMTAAMAFGIGIPLNVMQLMWINIISDIFPGLALSMEAPDPDVMNQKPRDPHAPIISNADFKRMAFESTAITGGSLAAYLYGISRFGMGNTANSIAFQALTIGQLLHAFSCRFENKNFLATRNMPPNRYLNWAVGGSLLLQLLTFVFPPLRNMLGLTPLGFMDAAVILGASALPLCINEATKKITER